MTTPTSTTPTWWKTQLKGIETWAILHWTYLAVALVANVIGAVFHI